MIKHLTVEQHKEITALNDMLKHYHRLAQALQVRLVSYIETETGIDLGKENWELDIEKGVLTHHERAE